MTSIFLIAELTNGYALFVPLMLVAALSFALDYYLEPYSIYTKKLSQSGELLTHNKDRSVLVFLDLPALMETDFYKISMNTTLGDVVNLISTVHRNIFPVVSKDGPCWASFNWTTCGPICSLRKNTGRRSTAT